MATFQCDVGALNTGVIFRGKVAKAPLSYLPYDSSGGGEVEKGSFICFLSKSCDIFLLVDVSDFMSPFPSSASSSRACTQVPLLGHPLPHIWIFTSVAFLGKSS